MAERDGRLAANDAGTGSWLGWGLGSGVLVPFVGPMVVYFMAGSSRATLSTEQERAIPRQAIDYRAAYADGYRERLRSRRKDAALKGGLIGTAVVFVTVVALGGPRS